MIQIKPLKNAECSICLCGLVVIFMSHFLCLTIVEALPPEKSPKFVGNRLFFGSLSILKLVFVKKNGQFAPFLAIF